MQKLLGGLKIHSAAGPDEIPARLLKEYASELAPALTLIFQASRDQSALPASSISSIATSWITWTTTQSYQIFNTGSAKKDHATLN